MSPDLQRPGQGGPGSGLGLETIIVPTQRRPGVCEARLFNEINKTRVKKRKLQNTFTTTVTLTLGLMPFRSVFGVVVFLFKRKKQHIAKVPLCLLNPISLSLFTILKLFCSLPIWVLILLACVYVHKYRLYRYAF